MSQDSRGTNAASRQEDPLKSSPKIEMDWELSQIFFKK